MPAYAIIQIDPTREKARLSKLDCLPPVIRFSEMSGAQLEIVGATEEEIQIIAAMINAIGERVADENLKAA